MLVHWSHAVARNGEAVRPIHVERSVDEFVLSDRSVAAFVKQLTPEVELVPIRIETLEYLRGVFVELGFELSIILEDEVRSDVVVEAVLKNVQVRSIATPSASTGYPVVGWSACIAMNSRPHFDLGKEIWLGVSVEK